MINTHQENYNLNLIKTHKPFIILSLAFKPLNPAYIDVPHIYTMPFLPKNIHSQTIAPSMSPSQKRKKNRKTKKNGSKTNVF